MAAALQLPPPDHRGLPLSEVALGYVAPQSPNLYSRRLTITELDLQDSRYPTSASTKAALPSGVGSSFSERVEDRPGTDMSRRSWIDYSTLNSGYTPTGWIAEKVTEEPLQEDHLAQRIQPPQDRSPATQHHQTQSHMLNNTFNSSGIASSYGFGREERIQRMSSNDAASVEPSRVVNEVSAFPKTPDMGQRLSGLEQYRERPPSLMPSTPRHPSLPLVGIGVGPSTSTLSPIVPLSAGPSYNPAAMAIPISPNPRAFAQQPKYITPQSGNPVYAPPQIPKEEVCVECAMRDQDMADVDVTSPGAWERESDALYEDLVRREEEDALAGLPLQESGSRPRVRGDKLIENNLKLWLSVNPKEPSSRQQTLDQYVKAQRSLLEAEALAHARAVRESRQLDDKMRDAYSQLRRSAYELGSAPQPADDLGGVRIKAPQSPTVPSHLLNHGHGRDVTLLESGMIVEHVDVKREEREERERRKKEERRERSRARKSSRSSRSGVDVMSVYSLQSPPHPTDSGFFSGVRPDSRFSQSMSARPSSVLTTGGEHRPSMLRAQSQASFSDMQSVGSSSPRRSRFFGLKNLSSGWRSQDSLAPSGSMIDMHVALQREQQYFQAHPSAVDIGSNTPTLRMGETWPVTEDKVPVRAETIDAKSTKKAKGLKKIWKIVTGSSSRNDAASSGRNQSQSLDRADDDQPLAPPPPLSYLMSRESGGPSSRRHVSTPSLPSSISPNAFSSYAPSLPTAPSSVIPSPTSSRPSGPEKENGAEGYRGGGHLGVEQDDRLPSAESPVPESDMRGRTTRSSSRTLSSFNGPLTPVTSPSQRPVSAILRRDKSLPPLPGESTVEFPNHPMPDTRPQTVFTYDPRGVCPKDVLLPPQAAFRTAENRRQSFGGISSRPHPAAQSLPTRGALARGQLNVPPFLPEQKFSEFGVSHMSFGQWPNAQYSQPSLQVNAEQKPKKRKSKFGLGSIFGRKSVGHDQKVEGAPPESLEYSGMRTSHSDSPYDAMVANSSGYVSPRSVSSNHAARQSVMSRKNIELVDQDREFVAYRYPSTDQRLDLVR